MAATMPQHQLRGRLIWAGSHERLSVFLDLTRGMPSVPFMRAFAEHWPMFDNTWYERDRLLARLRRHRPKLALADFLSPEDLDFYNALPDTVTVYRGCSRERLRGLSWSVSRGVAEGFARGHRGLRVPDPVVVATVIAKEVCLAAFDDRKESEVLIDPRSLTGVRLSWEGVE